MADDAPVVISTRSQRTTSRQLRDPSAPTRSGLWRPDSPFKRRDGLRITLKSERGVTKPGFLEVPFRFQAPPLDSYADEGTTDYPTFNTLRVGERPQTGGDQLERPTFESLLTDEEYPWQVWQGNFNYRRMVDELHALRRNKVGLRLIVGQPGLSDRPQTDGIFRITRVRAEDRGGERGSQYVSLDFIEWPPDDLTFNRRAGKADKDRRHTLHKGDTLYSIALDAYGRKSAWKTIARANGIPRHGPTGVNPGSAEGLEDWAAAHHKRSLLLPAVDPDPNGISDGGSPGIGHASS